MISKKKKEGSHLPEKKHESRIQHPKRLHV
jgi:hypothetical protein